MINIKGEKKKVAGIIVECNPFHKGHIRLIDECKKNADIVVAVMSGNFVQRGEPAVYSKEKRAYDLLAKGVDLVIEMPLYATLSSAKYFAKAGVMILDLLGFVDFIMFGSNVADVEKLRDFAKLTNQNDCEEFTSIINDNKYDSIIKKELKDGRSYPYAISKAMGIKLSANDILGVEYIRAVDELKSTMDIMTIKRKDDLPTASKLREKMKKKITCNDFSDILRYKLQYAKVMADNKDDNMLDDIYLMTKDIRNAIMKLLEREWKASNPVIIGKAKFHPYERAKSCKMDFNEIAMKLNTKNRTLANIKRILLNIIFDIKKEDIKVYGLTKFAPTNENKNIDKFMYIKVIGVRDDSKYLLKDIRIPYLMSYAPSSFKNFIEKHKRSKVVKKNRQGHYMLTPMIKKTILADLLYESKSQ